MALLLGGTTEPASRTTFAKTFDAYARDVERAVATSRDARERARLVLLWMHDRVLKQYAEEATTLGDIFTSGRFNCLSSAIFFNLLADRIGLSVAGEMLPTHARSLLHLEGAQRAVVETTSRDGFDPSAATLAAIHARVVQSASPSDRVRPLFGVTGAVVSTRELIWAIPINRGAIAQAEGHLALAEQLIFEAEQHANWGDDTRDRLRNLRVALLLQLAYPDLDATTKEGRERRDARIEEAVRLHANDPEIRQNAHVFLRAACERQAARAGDANDLLELDHIQKKSERLGLSGGLKVGLDAFIESERARVFVQRQDFSSAIAALDRALALPLAADDAELRKVLQQNRSTAELAKLVGERDCTAAKRLVEDMAKMGMNGEATERASFECHLIQADEHYRRGAFADAVRMLEAARGRMGDDDIVERNLAAVHVEWAKAAAKGKRCAEARRHLRRAGAEGRRVHLAECAKDGR